MTFGLRSAFDRLRVGGGRHTGWMRLFGLPVIYWLSFVVCCLVFVGCNGDETGTPIVGSNGTAVAGEGEPFDTLWANGGGETPAVWRGVDAGESGDPPAAFDTMRTSSIALHHVGGALFGAGNLVRRCRENMYLACPDLASSWLANPGYTAWEFTIRPDVTWHDGEPFTAEDAAFWFELAANGWESDGVPVRAPALFRGELGEIESVEVLEFNRLRVTLAEPNPHYLSVLANPRLRIAHPKHVFEPLFEDGEYSAGPLDVGVVGRGRSGLRTMSRAA